MQITVLGKSPSWQDADGACSGYLVEQDGSAVLLDCGNGVFGKLRAATDYTALEAIVISHMHADHFLDLVPFAYALTYGPRSVEGARPVLHAPPGARDLLRRIVGAWGGEDLVERAFALREYTADEELEAGPLRVRFTEVPHYVTAHAVELSCNGTRFTYGADCGPSEELVGFARATDMLLVEATLPEAGDEPDRGHLTAAEAGDHGRRAGARRLVITHISDELDCGAAHAAAERAFGAPVEMARPGAVYEL